MLIAMLKGAPLIPSKPVTGALMVNMMQLKKNQVLYDLGSGDGRLLIMAAQKGWRAVGVEINPYAVLWSYIRVVFAGVKSKVKIKWGNYWSSDLGSADGVVVYAMPNFMPRLATKLKHEVRKGVLIASNSFPIPGLKLVKKVQSGSDRVYLYKI